MQKSQRAIKYLHTKLGNQSKTAKGDFQLRPNSDTERDSCYWYIKGKGAESKQTALVKSKQ